MQRQKKCAHCGCNDHDNDLPCPHFASSPNCINCKGSHTSLDASCPEYTKQRNIQFLTASKNISLKEAKDLLSNSHSANTNMDFLNFPSLPRDSSSGGISPPLPGSPPFIEESTNRQFPSHIRSDGGKTYPFFFPYTKSSFGRL